MRASTPLRCPEEANPQGNPWEDPYASQDSPGFLMRESLGRSLFSNLKKGSCKEIPGLLLILKRALIRKFPGKIPIIPASQGYFYKEKGLPRDKREINLKALAIARWKSLTPLLAMSPATLMACASYLPFVFFSSAKDRRKPRLP